jgi:lysozyme
LGRQVNAAGLAIIKTGEGLRLEAYQDQRGIWTIGFGHTPAWPGEVISAQRAEQLLVQDCAWAAGAVDGATHSVATTDDQFSAMVSLTFNIGVAAFRGSTVLRQHLAGNHAAAADAFLLWDKTHIDGRLVVDPPLLARRRQERSLYLRS